LQTLEQSRGYETDAQSQLAAERYDVSMFEAHARHLIEAHYQIEHDNWLAEPQINARTALFEELTAKGHLSRVEYQCDAETANRQTLQRLLNGWSSGLPYWEQERRFREIVEELLIQQVFYDIQTGNLPPDTGVLTISDYAELAPPNEAHHIGYRFLNKKGMVREAFFEIGQDGQWHRLVEQVSRSNSNDRSSALFLANEAGCSVNISSSNQRLGKQVLISRERFPNGVVDVQRTLDFYAGPNIRYGEDISRTSAYLPDYDQLRQVSYQREAQLEWFINQLADFEKELNLRYHAGLISYDQKLLAICKQRTKIVDAICLLDPGYAQDARGEVSAKHFEKASVAITAGDQDTARQHFNNAMSAVDPRAAVVCGGNGATAAEAAIAAGQSREKSLTSLIGRKLPCVNKKCRKEVIVPASDLRGGILSCSKCGLVYDVCNKKSWFDKNKINDDQNTQPEPDGFDIILAALAHYDAEAKQKAAFKKLEENKMEQLNKDRDLANAA